MTTIIHHRPNHCPMDSCCYNIRTTGGCSLIRSEQCPAEKCLDEMMARSRREDDAKMLWRHP